MVTEHKNRATLIATSIAKKQTNHFAGVVKREMKRRCLVSSGRATTKILSTSCTTIKTDGTATSTCSIIKPHLTRESFSNNRKRANQK